MDVFDKIRSDVERLGNQGGNVIPLPTSREKRPRPTEHEVVQFPNRSPRQEGEFRLNDFVRYRSDKPSGARDAIGQIYKVNDLDDGGKVYDVMFRRGYYLTTNAQHLTLIRPRA